jgi:Dolichyl-phosphate-mannose-protein mannosyltransferase
VTQGVNSIAFSVTAKVRGAFNLAIGYCPSATQWFLMAALPCLLLLAQELPFFESRWVEDESWYSIPASNLLKETRLRNPTFPESDKEAVVDTRPPAMALTLAASFRLGGQGIAQARIPALVAAISTVIATFLLGSELISPLAGFLAALLLAADNFFFLASRAARPEIYVTLLTSVGVLVYLRGLKSQSRSSIALSGVAAGGAIAFHVCGLAAAASIVALIFMERGPRWYRKPRLWLFAVGVLAIMMPIVVWLNLDQSHRDAARAMYSRGSSMSTGQKVQAESTRYGDLIGLGSQRFALPLRVPYRIHIVVAAMTALVLLLRTNRTLAITIGVLLLSNLLLWIYLVNKTSRYFAIIAPMLAIALAAAAQSCTGRRRVIAWLVIAFLIASQVGGNLFYLARACQADYQHLSKKLVRIIPVGRPVYGAITFWMALRDRKYYSFERTPLLYALGRVKSFYLIANDRVMEKGSGYGNDDYGALSAEVEALVRLNKRVQLVGSIRDPFYGDLRIFYVHPAAGSADHGAVQTGSLVTH